jgi:hypothetical protein
MTCRAGFVWASPQHFTRFIEECGIPCELVTPHMLAAPFFRGSFSCLIIPTGFANPAYSNLLPALRASSGRIRRFVENGGALLVFGAAVERADAYDWLPFNLQYCHDCHPRQITISSASAVRTLLDDYDPAAIECDGSFPRHDGECAGRDGEADVLVEKQVGKGTIVVTSIHEYPSRKFLQAFCRDREPVTF